MKVKTKELEMHEIKEEIEDFDIPADVLYEIVVKYRKKYGPGVTIVTLDDFLEMAQTKKIRYALRSTINAGNIVGKVGWEDKEAYYVALLYGNTTI